MDDALKRILASLTALQANLPNGLVPEEFVTEYHNALGSLQRLGHDISGWRVPDAQLSRISGTGETLTGPGKRYVSEIFPRMKISTVLGYFRLWGSEGSIGFSPPKRA